VHASDTFRDMGAQERGSHQLLLISEQVIDETRLGTQFEFYGLNHQPAPCINHIMKIVGTWLVLANCELPANKPAFL